jgi:isopenicillin-N N-acyltransferase-like protein
VVRRVLKQETLDDALRCVVEAELAGAHNYLLLDRHGRGYNVEAMPGHCAVEPLDDEPLLHTNHCLAPETRALEAQKSAALLDSSLDRLERARTLCQQRPLDFERLVALTRDPGVCQRARPPFHIESSGAAIMRPASGDFWAVSGLPTEGEYRRLRLDGATAHAD